VIAAAMPTGHQPSLEPFKKTTTTKAVPIRANTA